MSACHLRLTPIDPLDVSHTGVPSTPRAAKSNAFNAASVEDESGDLYDAGHGEEPRRRTSALCQNGASGKALAAFAAAAPSATTAVPLKKLTQYHWAVRWLRGLAFGQHGHDQLPQGPSEVVLGDGEFPVAGVDEVDGLMRYWPVRRRRAQVGLSNEFVPASRVIPACGIQRCTADAPIRCDPRDLDPHLLSSSPVRAPLNERQEWQRAQ
jgi:hypothetical protein